MKYQYDWEHKAWRISEVSFDDIKHYNWVSLIGKNEFMINYNGTIEESRKYILDFIFKRWDFTYVGTNYSIEEIYHVYMDDLEIEILKYLLESKHKIPDIFFDDPEAFILTHKLLSFGG